MARRKIIAGNWKMNTTREEAISLINEILSKAPDSDILKIIFPPFPLIPAVVSAIHKNNHFFAGAQNCSEHAAGAYTGEVSAAMIASVDCRFVLIGHSERRMYFKESNSVLSLKMKQAFLNNLTPVYCVGELLEERKSNRHFDTVKKQLSEVFTAIPATEINKIIFAYEPVWAIGTGETATPEQAQEMHAFIRKCVKEFSNEECAASVSILYGGSCNAQNAASLFACKDIDGGLIGGASLKAGDFCKIIESMP